MFWSNRIIHWSLGTSAWVPVNVPAVSRTYAHMWRPNNRFFDPSVVLQFSFFVLFFLAKRISFEHARHLKWSLFLRKNKNELIISHGTTTLCHFTVTSKRIHWVKPAPSLRSLAARLRLIPMILSTKYSCCRTSASAWVIMTRKLGFFIDFQNVPKPTKRQLFEIVFRFACLFYRNRTTIFGCLFVEKLCLNLKICWSKTTKQTENTNNINKKKEKFQRPVDEETTMPPIR